MEFPRASGILLHPTSLPGPFGIGDLGIAAYDLCNWLADAGQTYWQILPLGPTGYGDSPYQCFSAFAGNTLLISPEKLLEDGLIEARDFDEHPVFATDHVDYGGVYDWKGGLLRKAFETFASSADHSLRPELEQFGRDNAHWLDDYALYRSLKARNGQRPWYEWPDDTRLRNGDALDAAQKELDFEIEAQKFYQFVFARQWKSLKGHANRLGLKIIGDIPIFVSLDSADVWRNQHEFKLNEDGSPKVVAGVPPDYFSATGQLWGNPIYDWEAMRGNGFQWWVSRLRTAVDQVDIVRLDHFRGFVGAWEVPGSDDSAENGAWANAPGRELFAAVRSQLGELPIIAEDLGVITDEVTDLRDSNGFPGMRILQYAFGGDAQNRDLPHNYISETVVYTGTHDNDTTVGWFHSQNESVRKHCIQYLTCEVEDVHWAMIRGALASVANTAIFPMQDILGLGKEGRMNLPATTGGNWSWRLTGRPDAEALARLRDLTTLYGRAR